MRHIIPAANWVQHLAAAVERAADGDVIVVATDAAKALAERAIKRQRPGARLTVEVEASD